METMTREEQIRNAAEEHFAHSWRGSVKDAFAEGAQWADQHPKDNLVDIDKVCEWIKNNISSYLDWYDWERCRVSKDELIKDFRKSMEEQL